MKTVFFLSVLILSTSVLAKDSVTFEVLTQRQDVVWGMDFLPDEKIIFTEKAGKIFIYDPKAKTTTEVKGVPEVYSAGQGGLLDIRLHPDFKKNSLLYFSYSEPVKDNATTSVIKAKLVGNELKESQKIFAGVANSDEDEHFGSRIEFDGKGHIFFTMGDRGQRDKAQDLSVHQGKVLRLNEDGSVPQDNPFVKTKGALPEIWSLGHRSPQGLTRHPVTGDLWEAEMGPRGGDEVNLIAAGKNYGWPVITYGREYWGPKIGQTEKTGLEQPLIYWVPSISPSAIAFYSGDKIPQWKHHLFLATLSGEHIHRVAFDGTKVLNQEELLKKLEYRFRSVRNGPDGYLYFSTDDGKIGRLVLTK